MKKEDLMKIEGMTEELATQIAEQSAEELKGFIPKTRFDEVNEAKKNAESLIKERDKQIEGLKSVDADSLKKQIEELQETNKETVKTYEANIKKMQIDNAVQSALTTSGALNSKAVQALLTDADKFELAEDGTVKGLADQIKALQKSDSYLFKTKDVETPKPSGVTPVVSGQQASTGTVTKEQFVKMGYKERVDLFNTNKELYDSLAGTSEQ